MRFIGKNTHLLQWYETVPTAGHDMLRFSAYKSSKQDDTNISPLFPGKGEFFVPMPGAEKHNQRDQYNMTSAEKSSTILVPKRPPSTDGVPDAYSAEDSHAPHAVVKYDFASLIKHAA
jgi:hypothetical protein